VRDDFTQRSEIAFARGALKGRPDLLNAKVPQAALISWLPLPISVVQNPAWWTPCFSPDPQGVILEAGEQCR
jgi:hypothetical protein